MLKLEIFGKESKQELNEENINFLVDLTRDIIEIIRKEIQMVDFWESISKQKILKSYIISHLLKLSSGSQKEKYQVKESSSPYLSIEDELDKKRSEIAQKLMELSYNIYGK